MRQWDAVITELPIGPFIDIAEGFAVANEKKAHQPSPHCQTWNRLIMNASGVRGNIAGRRFVTGRLACDNQLCRAFPQSVIFLKHESGFGRLYERWGMSRSS
ncbi:hypothetical protein RHECNPAF_4090024 [Rhizobium etli CNPAF512]|nr:hypothetical protein RHECNPAF_4090024 [Rhizobium etli CNPAF512]